MDKCCDNPLCPQWHGQKEYHVKLGRPETNLEHYNELTVGEVTITVCRPCERAIDIFFALLKKKYGKKV